MGLPESLEMRFTYRVVGGIRILYLLQSNWIPKRYVWDKFEYLSIRGTSATSQVCHNNATSDVALRDFFIIDFACEY